MASNRMPTTSVRGRIRSFIERHAAGLGADVLEIGSRQHVPGAWWVVNRDLAQGRWLGMDMQPGDGVDVVADLHALPDEWAGRFTGVLCSEVLEHVARPWMALPALHRAMRPGGLLIVTTLFAFPEHGFPDDYYRYTGSGLRLLLEDAGFTDVQTEYAGGISLQLNDHGERGMARRSLPMHIFATASA